MKKMYFVIIMMTLASGSAMAQRVADKELIGTWLLETAQWDGERTIVCGSEYTRFKFFGADGEYACAELAKTKEGKYLVIPHEYGTYTFKNGKYTEMGREATLVLDSKTTSHGKWKNLSETWKKATDMPKELVDYIVLKCKVHQGPTPEMQQLIKKHCFK